MPDSTEPLNLDSIESTGAERFGAAVVKAIFVLDDGRIQKVMPRVHKAAASGRERPTGRAGRVLSLLEASPVPLSRKQIAARLGVHVDPKRGVTGGLAMDINKLIADGWAYEPIAGLISNDLRKFTGGASIPEETEGE